MSAPIYSETETLQTREPDPPFSAELAKLLIAPFAVTLLLAGGVYWLRMQPPPGAAHREQASTVMVHLVPHPLPAPAPAPAPSQIISNSDTALAEPSHDDQDEAPRAVPQAATSPETQKAPLPRIEGHATAAPSEAAARFQQAVLRRLGPYQRYPAAALQGRLQGSVHTYISLRRDGTLVDVWVKRSGQSVLDNEAIATVRRAQPLPPIPPELPNRLNIEVILAFDPP
jgi:protein TonB